MADKVVQLKNKDGDKLYPVSVLPGERILWEDSMEPAPTMENVEDMTGATSSAAGKHGLVPAPAAGDQDKVLKGDGTWGTASGGATVWRTTQSMPSAQDATNTITYSTLSDPTGAKIYTAAVIGDLVIDGSGRMGQITSITAGSNLCEVTMVLTKMTGATSSASGKGGLVPFPNSAAVNKFLKGDGTWSDANFYMGYSSLITLNTTIGQTTTVSNYLTNLTPWDGTLSSITPPIGSIVVDAAGTVGYIISTSGSNAVVGTMHVNNVMTGATSAVNGVAGLVPQPSAGDEGKALSGAGTWEEYTQHEEITPGSVGASDFVMQGATASADGLEGFVPKPEAGDQAAFLQGNGTWATATDITSQITNENDSTWTSRKIYKMGPLVFITGNLRRINASISPDSLTLVLSGLPRPLSGEEAWFFAGTSNSNAKKTVLKLGTDGKMVISSADNVTTAANTDIWQLVNAVYLTKD